MCVSVCVYLYVCVCAYLFLFHLLPVGINASPPASFPRHCQDLQPSQQVYYNDPEMLDVHMTTDRPQLSGLCNESVGQKAHVTEINEQVTVCRLRAQELCESRGGRPGLPVPNSPDGLCGGL